MNSFRGGLLKCFMKAKCFEKCGFRDFHKNYFITTFLPLKLPIISCFSQIIRNFAVETAILLTLGH